MSADTRSGGLGDPLLTIKDVAHYLRCSTRKVQRMIKKGDLAIVRVGRSVLVRPEALKAMIEGK